jgi:hypothetical protein
MHAGWEPWLAIAILSDDQAKRLHPELTRDRLGVAPSSLTIPGHVAYVSW